MPKENKNSTTTRLPEELKAELRKVQAPYLAKGVEAPSFGFLLLEAWNTSQVLASEKLRAVAEILSAPDTTETLPLKSQIEVAINEYRKKHPKEKAAVAGADNRRRKTGS